jgi:hypothetical protein
MSFRYKSVRSRAADCARLAAGVAGKRGPRTLMLALAMLHSATAAADKLTFSSGPRQVTLLELYTSQGCSSCPPAERWLNDYVDDKDLWTRIVPLAFHVDYWDYIGWKDAYALPEYGERQREYARRGKAHTVVTPALFTNGQEWRGWSLRLKPRASSSKPGDLSAIIQDGYLTVEFDTLKRESYELHVAILGFGIKTKVKSGENRNSTLAQEFVVLAHDWHRSGTRRWHVSMPRPRLEAERYGVALWVSKPGRPTPIQATGGWLVDENEAEGEDEESN